MGSTELEILNNPVWHAMHSGNKHLTREGVSAKSFHKDISPFVGLEDLSAESFKELQSIPTEHPIVIVTSEYGIPTNAFKVLQREQIVQMVFNNKAIEQHKNESIELNNIHVSQMLELTQLTKPGPFLKETIRFGSYFGIMHDDKLVAMAGRRFHADECIEISAVCTHPDFTGKGYAANLIIDEINKIKAIGCTPFLNVRPDNENAIRLYKKLGFKIHQQMNLLVLTPADQNG